MALLASGGARSHIAGQNTHFRYYVHLKRKLEYAISRFTNETGRLYAVLNRQLEEREFVAGEYSIADMACYPWIVQHSKHSQDLGRFPNVRRWMSKIAVRTAVVAAYRLADEVEPNPVVTDESRKFLFGQSADSTGQADLMRFTTRPEIRGTFGAVASTHWLASAVGMATLERGGNAFDAAVTAGFVLQVVEPHLNGPAGEVPILCAPAKSEAPWAICGQGPVPAAATIPHFRFLGLSLIPGSGLLAACVPGAFGAWLTLLMEFGTMRLRDVLGPAIGYAMRGYPLVENIAVTIASVESLFKTEWPSSARIYLPHGVVPKPGTLFRNPELGRLYGRVLAYAEKRTGREVHKSGRLSRIGIAAKSPNESTRSAAIHQWRHQQAINSWVC